MGAFLSWVGWLVITGLAIYAAVGTAAMFVVSKGFTGRVSPLMLVPLSAALALAALAWFTAPFELVLRS